MELFTSSFLFLNQEIRLKTPGREDEEEDGTEADSAISNDLDVRAYKTIEALGGPTNIKQVDYCTTRLRMTVGDVDQVDEKC